MGQGFDDSRRSVFNRLGKRRNTIPSNRDDTFGHANRTPYASNDHDYTSSFQTKHYTTDPSSDYNGTHPDDTYGHQDNLQYYPGNLIITAPARGGDRFVFNGTSSDQQLLTSSYYPPEEQQPVVWTESQYPGQSITPIQLNPSFTNEIPLPTATRYFNNTPLSPANSSSSSSRRDTYIPDYSRLRQPKKSRRSEPPPPEPKKRRPATPIPSSPPPSLSPAAGVTKSVTQEERCSSGESVISMDLDSDNLMLPDWGEDSDNEAKLQAIAYEKRRQQETEEEQRRLGQQEERRLQEKKRMQGEEEEEKRKRKEQDEKRKEEDLRQARWERFLRMEREQEERGKREKEERLQREEERKQREHAERKQSEEEERRRKEEARGRVRKEQEYVRLEKERRRAEEGRLKREQEEANRRRCELERQESERKQREQESERKQREQEQQEAEQRRQESERRRREREERHRAERERQEIERKQKEKEEREVAQRHQREEDERNKQFEFEQQKQEEQRWRLEEERIKQEQQIQQSVAEVPVKQETTTGAQQEDDGNEPLPVGWEVHYSRSTSKGYFYNVTTGESTWERPRIESADGPQPQQGATVPETTPDPTFAQDSNVALSVKVKAESLTHDADAQPTTQLENIEVPTAANAAPIPECNVELLGTPEGEKPTDMASQTVPSNSMLTAAESRDPRRQAMKKIEQDKKKVETPPIMQSGSSMHFLQYRPAPRAPHAGESNKIANSYRYPPLEHRPKATKEGTPFRIGRKDSYVPHYRPSSSAVSRWRDQ